jgi:hypothetical protein
MIITHDGENGNPFSAKTSPQIPRPGCQMPKKIPTAEAVGIFLA